MMRAMIPGTTVLLLLTASLPAPQEPAVLPTSGESLPSSGVAARVNRDIITWREIDERIGFVPEPENREALRRETRRKMVQDMLFLQKAREHGVTVTEQEIDQQVQREQKPFPTEQDYIDYLRAYKAVTRTQNRELHGRDIQIKKLYYFMVRQAYTNPAQSEVPLMVDFVPPAEVRAYYKKNRGQFEAKEYVHVGRIGMQFGGPAAKAAKLLMAEAALRKLAEGTHFIALASRISDLRVIQEDGRPEYTLRLDRESDFFSDETKKLLFETLEEAKISGIIEEGNTINIFLLLQRVRRDKESFTAVQSRITRFLESRNREKNRKRLLQILIDRAFLEPCDIFSVK